MLPIYVLPFSVGAVPASASKTMEDKSQDPEHDAVDEFGAKDYRSLLLKVDNRSRPLWVVSWI